MTPRPWKKWITRAKVVGHFTRHNKAQAQRWPSCAVGECLPGLTVHRAFHLPGDLQALGIAFNRAVKADDVDRAANVYRLIQQYVKEMPN